MTLRTFTFAELAVSPLNVRINAEDAEATGALEASIHARGLLFPLVVHPLEPGGMDSTGARWGVLAGGRRLRAIGRLIEQGHLPADWPIDAVIRDVGDAEITELSLAENLLRRELRPYEVHAAIAKAKDQGATPEEIAGHLGQRIEWVNQQLRLGMLAEEIFAAYASGEIGVDEARAYAATEDQALQRAAFAHFTRLLLFVGTDTYRDAGGRFELDLFADGPPGTEHERGRVVDEGLLRELAENRLAHLKGQIRIAAQDSDLQFLAAPPQHGGVHDWSLSVDVAARKVRGELRYDLPHPGVAAHLAIQPDGTPGLSWWWPSRKAKRAASGDDAAPQAGEARAVPVDDAAAFDTRDGFGAAQAARAAAREDWGLTADALQTMRSIRRELLRALLVRDAIGGGTLGRDYIVWAQLRQELGNDRGVHTGARGLSGGWHGSEDSEPREFVRGYVERTGAHAEWNAAVQAVTQSPFITLADPAEAFAAFLSEPEAARSLAGAVLAGLALLRSANVQGWRISVHDRLAAEAGASDEVLRDLWQPDAGFIGLFSRMARLEIASLFVDPAAFRSWPKLKDAALSGATAGALDPASHPSGPLRDAAARWVHPLLSFVTPATEPAPQKEAAE